MQYYNKHILINKFLETNYPQGRAIVVFRSFHFDLKVQKRNLFITPHPKLSITVLTSPQVEVSKEPRGKASRNSFD